MFTPFPGGIVLLSAHGRLCLRRPAAGRHRGTPDAQQEPQGQPRHRVRSAGVLPGRLQPGPHHPVHRRLDRRSREHHPSVG
ncbi:hypothetical protein SBRY_50750 [Actinacidiphila bryophytorum]|uniref:Uncharacterized protein n=1 Tax=Actinacidiphila bryophytorum TaxID=1436133 RepID=A0A9W4H5F4_9ACTN|nr:hypothetical protein SBRY_50750 [Actinacidiphila bryophytorum]